MTPFKEGYVIRNVCFISKVSFTWSPLIINNKSQYAICEIKMVVKMTISTPLRYIKCCAYPWATLLRGRDAISPLYRSVRFWFCRLMVAVPRTESFPWKWNDCMTDPMNHDYVHNSWTRPCLAISLWGILFRNQTTLCLSLLGILWLPFMSAAWAWVSTKEKKIHKGRRDVANCGNLSRTRTVNWEGRWNSGSGKNTSEAARKYFVDPYLKSLFTLLQMDPCFPD